MKKRFLSILIVAVMLVVMIPFSAINAFAAENYSVIFTDGGNVDFDGAYTVTAGQDYVCTLESRSVHAINCVMVYIGQMELDSSEFSFNSENGKLTIPAAKVTDLIEIYASAPDTQEYSVTFSGDHPNIDILGYEANAYEGSDYIFVLGVHEGYKIKTLIVNVGGVGINTYMFDETTGEFKIPKESITGHIEIYIAEDTIKASPSTISDVILIDDDEKKVEAYFEILDAGTLGSPQIYEIVGGEKTSVDVLSDEDEYDNHITLSYTFSADDFNGTDGKKTYVFGLSVAGEWYYTNEFTVTYRQDRFIYDVEYGYDTFTYEVMPYNVRGEENATEGVQYSAVIDILPGCTFNDIVVKRGGAVVLDRNVGYSFNESSGLLVIVGEEITEDIQIFIYVDGTPESAAITLDYTNAQAISAPAATLKLKDYIATFEATGEYELSKESFTIVVGAITLDDSAFDFDAESGALTVYGEYITDNMTISVSGKAPKLVVTDDDKYDIPNAVRGTEVSVDLTDSVSGGIGPYVFSIDTVEGTNNWLELSPEGILHGTRPMQATSFFSINVKVTDAEGQTDTMWVLVGATEIEEHVCAENLLTEEENIPSDCETPGNIGYYICKICEAYYEDPLASSEILDKTSVIIPAGHRWETDGLIAATGEIHTSDRLEPAVAAHYHCERCDKYFDEHMNPVSYEELKDTPPVHSYSVVNGYKGANGHADACICGAHDAGSVEPHTDSCVDDDCTTENKCTVCNYIIEAARTDHEPISDVIDCTLDRKCQHCDQIALPGEAHHTAGEDDNDCTTDIMCINPGCTQVATPGNDHHTAGADDDNCTTDIMCSNPGCTQVATPGNTSHTPDADDNNCTTDVMCSNPGCEQVAIAKMANHTPEADDNNCTTDIICSNPGCTQVTTAGNASHTPKADDGDCTTDVMCNNPGCTQVATAGKTSHTPSADDGDCTTDVMCSVAGCTKVATAGKTSHTPGADDGDCTTDVMCNNPGCTKVATAGKTSHTPSADDGDCTTAVKCSVEGCNKIAIEAKTAHADANNDGRCDACGTETGTNAPSTPSIPSEPSAPSEDNEETNAPATDASTDAGVTESEKEEDTEAEEENEEEPEATEKKGCGSMISLSGLVVVTVLGAGVTFAKRKED